MVAGNARVFRDYYCIRSGRSHPCLPRPQLVLVPVQPYTQPWTSFGVTISLLGRRLFSASPFTTPPPEEDVVRPMAELENSTWYMLVCLSDAHVNYGGLWTYGICVLVENHSIQMMMVTVRKWRGYHMAVEAWWCSLSTEFEFRGENSCLTFVGWTWEKRCLGTLPCWRH